MEYANHTIVFLFNRHIENVIEINTNNDMLINIFFCFRIIHYISDLFIDFLFFWLDLWAKINFRNLHYLKKLCITKLFYAIIQSRKWSQNFDISSQNFFCFRSWTGFDDIMWMLCEPYNVIHFD